MIKINEDFTVTKTKEIPDIDFTSLMGEVECSYKQLVEVFGKETNKGDDYKSQAEWHIITPKGIATVYDWKECKKYCGKEGISKQEVTDWHIGGNTVEVVGYIKGALGIK